MRFTRGIAFGLFATVAWSQSGTHAGSEPSLMEAFANAQGTNTTWSKEVSRLEHEGTSAVLTALVVEDHAEPARKMRGVLIVLASANAHDQIFLDEAAAERTRSALTEIADAVAKRGIPGGGCMGAKEFWPLYDWPWNKYHELNADLCGASQSFELVLYGRGKQASFKFPGETPTHLAGILSTAMDELTRH